MAPTISRKRRVQANPVNPEADPELENTSIMDHFPDAPKTKEAKKEEPSVADLMQQLGKMQERLDAQERDFARASAVTPSPTQQPVNVGEEPKLDLTNLPDPVTQATEYAQAILQRGREYDAKLNAYNSRKEQATKPAQLGDPDALFNDFTEQYPEYAEQSDRMEWVTARVAKKLAQRRIDVQLYMYQHSDAFFKELTKEYDKTFGAPEGDDEVHVQVQEVQPSRKRRAKQTDDVDDGDDGRAASILSQTERGPAQVTQQQDGRPNGMISELQEIQRKTGYF